MLGLNYELVGNNDFGYIVESLEVDHITDSIKKAINDTQNQTIASKAKNLVNQEYNIELDELYEKINSIGKVDLIFSGHEHTKQHIYIPDKPNMVICGVGSDIEDNIKYMITLYIRLHNYLFFYNLNS